MKYTQFVKQFRDDNKDLGMSYADCMKSEEVKKAFKEFCGCPKIQQKDGNVNVILQFGEKEDSDKEPSMDLGQGPRPANVRPGIPQRKPAQTAQMPPMVTPPPPTFPSPDDYGKNPTVFHQRNLFARNDPRLDAETKTMETGDDTTIPTRTTTFDTLKSEETPMPPLQPPRVPVYNRPSTDDDYQTVKSEPLTTTSRTPPYLLPSVVTEDGTDYSVMPSLETDPTVRGSRRGPPSWAPFLQVEDNTDRDDPTVPFRYLQIEDNTDGDDTTIPTRTTTFNSLGSSRGEPARRPFSDDYALVDDARRRGLIDDSRRREPPRVQEIISPTRTNERPFSSPGDLDDFAGPANNLDASTVSASTAADTTSTRSSMPPAEDLISLAESYLDTPNNERPGLSLSGIDEFRRRMAQATIDDMITTIEDRDALSGGQEYNAFTTEELRPMSDRDVEETEEEVREANDRQFNDRRGVAYLLGAGGLMEIFRQYAAANGTDVDTLVRWLFSKENVSEGIQQIFRYAGYPK